MDLRDVIQKMMPQVPRPEDLKTISGEDLDTAATKYTHFAIVVPLDAKSVEGMKNVIAGAMFIFSQVRMKAYIIPVVNGNLPPGAKVEALEWKVE